VDHFVSEDKDLRVFSRNADEYGIDFSEGWPGGKVALYAGKDRIPLQQEFNEAHYAIVKKADFYPAYERGELIVQQEE
jgi:hypothetical protein